MCRPAATTMGGKKMVLRHAEYPDDSDDSKQDGPGATSNPRGAVSRERNRSTVSGAFFAESLLLTGTQVNPGAMMTAQAKPPTARTDVRTPGSPPGGRHASSRMSTSSPRRLAEADGRSGTVMIWGDGWTRSASPSKSATKTLDPSPYLNDGVFHPVVSEHAEHDPATTPRLLGFGMPKQDEEFVGHKMLNVCGGFGKLALIRADGSVVQGGEDEDALAANIEVPECGAMRQIAAGQRHTLFLNADGLVYAGGHNTFGQLGFPGDANVSMPRPIPAFAQRPVAAVACGQHHSLALTDWGDVYAWGRGSEGQTGSGHFETVPVPRYVHGLKGKLVDSIACGYMCSMAVTQQGQLYTWGDDTTGQLGLGPKAGRRCSPQLVVLDAAAFGLACDGATWIVGASGGWGHTCAVTSAGLVWSWGFGGRGQLGLGDYETRSTPAAVKGELVGVHVQRITCGAYFTVALTFDGRVYVWGSGSHFRLGLGDDQDRCMPTLATVKGRDITQVAVAEDRVLAFAPARIVELIPKCGPLSGGTRVNVAGDGFFQAPRIKVSMDMSAAVSELDQDGEGQMAAGLKVFGLNTLRDTAPVSHGSEVRLVRGALDPYTGMVVFDTPAHDRPSACLVEVSLDNGETYTSSDAVFTFYADPVIEAVQPPARLASGHVSMRVRGLGLEYGGSDTRLRFAAAGQAPVDVSAEWDPVELCLVCKSPPLPAGAVTVQVALNGQQYSPNAGELVYYEPPQVLAMLPDCCPSSATVTTVTLTLRNPVPLQPVPLTVRLHGKAFAKDLILTAYDLVMAADGTGTVKIDVPLPEALGSAQVQLSLDGLDWLQSSPAVATFHVFDAEALQPVLKFKNAYGGPSLPTGAALNALVDDGLFASNSMLVRVGESTFERATFDAAQSAAVFSVPPYDASTMGDDPLAVQVWLYPQGAEGPGIDCSAARLATPKQCSGSPLRYFATDPEAPLTASMTPTEGPAGTALSISGENFPDAYLPPEPEPAAEGQEDAEAEEAGGPPPATEPATPRPEAPCHFVRLGQSLVVPALFEDGCVTCETPSALHAGQCLPVYVSFEGPKGAWFPVGDFTVV